MSCKVHTLPHVYTEGDTLPEMVCVLDDTDLSGYTITAYVDRPTTVLSKVATAVDLANGQFKFVWVSTDLVAGYGQEVAIEFNDGSGGIETITGLRLDVAEALA